MYLHFMQSKHKLYKKLFVFGVIFLLFSIPLMFILEIQTADFHTHLNDLTSDKGIICALFCVGVVFVCIGLIIKAFTKG